VRERGEPNSFQKRLRDGRNWQNPRKEHIANREQIVYIACLQSIPAVRRGRVVGGSNPGHKERDIMSQPALRLVEGSSMDKSKALSAALSQIERQFGKGSVMKLGKKR
jgi:hypothetical protein